MNLDDMHSLVDVALWFDGTGRPRELRPEDLLPGEARADKPEATSGFVWFHMTNPELDDISTVGSRLGIHPVALGDFGHGWQRPKLEPFDGHVYLMVWDIVRPTDVVAFESGELFLYFGESWLLTIQRGEPSDLRDIRAALEEPSDLPATSPLDAVYRILVPVVQDYIGAASAMEDELDEVEAEVFNPTVQEDYLRIYRLRQSIARVDRAASGVATALESGREELERFMREDRRLAPHLRHLYNDAVGVSALTTDQHQALDAVVSSHESNVAYRQNKDMRTISAFAALLAVPTVIAGIYGMNFKNLPLVQWQFGWIAIGAAIVVIDVIEYVIFKRRGWL